MVEVTGEPIAILRAPADLPAEVVALGERLFHDARLSNDHTVSCASCHDLGRGGVDRARVSRGVAGRMGVRNAPTVFNSGLNFVQFWDGRAETLEAQIDSPVHSEFELASDWATIVAELQRDPAMVAAFDAAMDGDGEISADTIRQAIATFERSLVTVDSPFDRYLAGERDAIGEWARRGYALFKDLGCASCHQGANVGGNMFQRLGVAQPYEDVHEDGSPPDLGRYQVTGNAADKHLFRVPSLRLAVLTPPYFHDGEQETLRQAVDTMARYQLGRILSADEIDLIIAFLRTLPGRYRGVPVCPESECP